MRSYLALAAAGVDRAQLYMLRDVNAGNTVQYNSSGLTSEKWNQHQPKRSWYYVATLRHILRGTRFESEDPLRQCQRAGLPIPLGGSASREVYAVWCPTSDSTEVKDFRLAVPDASAATLITLGPQSATGQAAPLAIEDGKVAFNVSEQPVFVTVP